MSQLEFVFEVKRGKVSRIDSLTSEKEVGQLKYIDRIEVRGLITINAASERGRCDTFYNLSNKLRRKI